MAGIGTSAGNARADKLQMREAQRERTRADDDRERSIWMAGQQDWTPEYASDHIAPYQRSTSPVADSFLESLITGDNPAAVQGTRNLAPQMKARAQQSFDNRTGGWDQIRQRQAEMERSTPWEVKPFTREISQPDVSKNAWEAEKAGGLSADEMEQLRRAGFKFNEQGQFRTKASGNASRGAMRGAAANPDSPRGRQYMRGVARMLDEGYPLEDIVKNDEEYILARGGE